jgi:glyoxylase-like metal-dependent hydrolase (beta-lactamase superfamily II)
MEMTARVSVGTATIIALSDAEQPYGAGTIYPEAGEPALAAYRAFQTDSGEIVLNFGCYAIRADGRTVLVDTGWGPAHQGRLMDEMAEAGIQPQEVDTVVFTHLHGDHIGWNMVRDGDELRPRFARARYLAPDADWRHYRSQPEPSALFREHVMPLASLGVMDLIGGGHVISRSVTTVATPGHTPGHLSIAITSGGEHGFVLGDVAISAIEATETDWAGGFDWDRDLARRTRKAVLDRLERDRAIVAASHFPKPGLGRFERRDGVRVWEALRS